MKNFKQNCVVRTFGDPEGRITYQDLIEMKKEITNKHNKDLVLVTGENVSTDVALMNYESDVGKGLPVFSIIDQHIISEKIPANMDYNTAVLFTCK